MSVVNVLSQALTNFQAQPKVLNSSYLTGGPPTTGTSLVAIGATDSIGSTYRIARIRSGALLSTLKVRTDGITSGVYKAGVLNNLQQSLNLALAGSSGLVAPGAVPVTYADQIFGTGIALGAANTVDSDVLTPAILNGTQNAAATQLRVWELLGFTQDPIWTFDLTLTCTAAPSAGGNVAVKYTWVS